MLYLLNGINNIYKKIEMVLLLYYELNKKRVLIIYKTNCLDVMSFSI